VNLEAVRKITFRADAQGVHQTTASLNKMSGAVSDLTDSEDKTTRATQRLENAQRQAVGASYNLAQSVRAANDNYASFGQTLTDHISGFVSNVAHLKLLAAAAYALSPAFRSFTNSGVVAVLGQFGGVMGPLATAASKTFSALSPALSFFARLTIPIGLAVAAWELLNGVIQRGSGLLDQYATRSANSSPVM
jgi:hypothetical protein